MVNNGLQWFTMVYQWFCQNITNPSGSSHEEQLVAKRLTLLPMVYQWVTMVYQWTHVKSMPFSHSLDIATEQFPPNLIYVYIHVNFCFFVGPIYFPNRSTRASLQFQRQNDDIRLRWILRAILYRSN